MWPMEHVPDRHSRPLRERSGPRPGLALVAVVAVATIGLIASQHSNLGQFDALFEQVRPVRVEVDGQAVRVPSPEPADGRVLPSVAVTTQGSYAFLDSDEGGNPIGYDPCRPVYYVIRQSGAPAGGDEIVADAVAIVSQATGLEFVYEGTTDEFPAVDRDVIQPDRYGTGWAPVLIAWATTDEVEALQGRVAGIGGSAVVPGADGTGKWLAAGRLVLDSADIGSMISAGDVATARAVVVHELGHVVGLDHVDDPAELMSPMTTFATELGPGDLAGLALVGQVECQE